LEELKKDQLCNLENCPICKSTSKLIDIVKTINSNSREILNLRECKYCKHWWIDPMPEQQYLNHLYEIGSEFVVSSGYQGREKPEDSELNRYILRFLKISEDIIDLNYLEIGVGPGYLFNFFDKKVKNCYGVDPCSWKPYKPTIFSDINRIPKGIKFDIIVIQDVLEHLEDPINMLIKVRKLANPGCKLSCGFPNKDALIAKILKGRWSMIRPIGHLHYFSSKSIKKMFKKSGWEIVKKYSYWPVPYPSYYLKNFNFHSKNPLKLIYRIFRDLVLKQLLFGKDQWYVVGKA